MSCVPEEALQRRCAIHSLDKIAFQTVDSTQPVTLEYLMRDYIDHLKHHLRQIFPDDAGLN
jgi:hypothetical protein